MSWILGALIGAVVVLAAIGVFVIYPIIRILIEYSEHR